MANTKEMITPPTAKELADASQELRKGHSCAGRTMADASVAKREGVTRLKKTAKRQ